MRMTVTTALLRLQKGKEGDEEEEGVIESI